MSKIYAIGDVHGCNSLLIKLLAAINPQKHDTVIFLGDVIDRGEDSKGVLDTIIQYQSICQVILIQGNHEEMMLGAVQEKEYLKYWLKFGGIETLQSFDVVISQQGLRQIPYEYYKLLKSSLPYHETENFIFTHATPLPHLPINQQTDEGLRWRFIPPDGQERHISGKTIICGHSAQKSGKVYHQDGLICIDTDAYGGGALTVLEVTTMQVYQVK
ncbi:MULTISPECIES: metallophosphoesterase family protein [Moraxella]|jgi:serine/threonine protein phosphatase 1|uniref:metallophosphoesterase family protein n=1 Tax=Moraxella sp. CTOTU49803 TaxID=2953840 RepID=UPI0004B487E2|nr:MULTISPECIES: metallophosphoesterase family protein [Moraxella]MBW4010596.1 serine/threonine protein phosphatase [Moraxella osloensis]